ncbi:MAG: phosphoribosylformylglycinamidine synthase [Eubacteriales bacterium]|nr:phosphoribosylformylglycinamidine synthase [Eubacteriales bacterium]
MGSINEVRRIYVTKKSEYAAESVDLVRDLKHDLGIGSIDRIVIYNRYDISGVSETEFNEAKDIVFSEPPVDDIYVENIDTGGASFVFGIESLPGQFNQRADSAAQCVQILTQNNRPQVVTAKIVVIYGFLTETDKDKIVSYLVNPVESRIASMFKPLTLDQKTEDPYDVALCEGFIGADDISLLKLSSELGFAMSLDDLKCVRDHFASEKREPSLTELRVLDTYWSDHCRHTTFLTEIEELIIADADTDEIAKTISSVYDRYISARAELYGDIAKKRPVCLMDVATAAVKLLRKQGKADDLDISDEINACSIRVPVKTDSGIEDHLIMFKNETHNHPTEIEPFGGAATCLGGAIRDPLSGRVYVYQAMRVTGAADPTVPVSETLPGKLPQRKITTGAAAGYSSYGNQIGLATGLVNEIYHKGYMAKRMEIGAVIGAAPAANVVRSKPVPGDLVILLGGRTGRDGCGGATGSSKEHDEFSIEKCGAEVQKGNPPTERKIQRLFRDPAASHLIKKCNDFGAGGVCVAIGELADGILIDLDKIPKKYEGLDGTELAISESQERMAVVVSPENEAKFLELSAIENLEAVTVAYITEEPRMRMVWRSKTIVDIPRKFIDTNGAAQKTKVRIEAPDIENAFFDRKISRTGADDFEDMLIEILSDLSTCSRKGLAERFDSTIGAGTILMPYGGRNQLTPENGMAALVPHLTCRTKTATLMTYGFDPYLSEWSPFHGAYYAVLESLAAIAALGGDPLKCRLTFQEYFEKPGRTPERWGKPMAALLGGYKAQLDFGTPAIGGKDSMSGTFKDIDVPPTLVSFAVCAADPDKVISAAFSPECKEVILLPVEPDDSYLPDPIRVKAQYKLISDLSDKGIILSASVVKASGIAAEIAKMGFGNDVGFEIDSTISADQLFKPLIGSIIIQLDISDRVLACEIPEIAAGLDENLCVNLGVTLTDSVIKYKSFSVSLDRLKKVWGGKLESVFPTHSVAMKGYLDLSVSAGTMRTGSKIKVAAPKVFIPIFPGTNCEYDTAGAFRRAGAEAETLVFRNNSPSDIADSIQAFSKAISRANILMIPGGFSGGDEPDGSGKFIAAAFRNQYIADEIEKLLYVRDGLVLGICNGFQALLKLGLLPFGHISSLKQDSATLTYNTIGRHVSSYVRTKVVSRKSPWLSLCKDDDVHMIPVSHGEGRFIAPDPLVQELASSGQIATVYVGPDEKPSMEMPYNPNGSVAAIEGITSPDGRVLGKMGHSERTGPYIAVNIPGPKDQMIFESGVEYFK